MTVKPPLCWLLLALFSAATLPLFCQAHHDNNWIMSDLNGAVQISFTDGTPKVDSIEVPIIFEGASFTMSDAQGKLQFYSNGCAVYGADHELLTNGDTLNFGEVYNRFCNLSPLPRGYPGGRSSNICIPRPDYPDQYYIFHKSKDYFPEPIPNEDIGFYSRMYYAVVDMQAANGAGALTEKHVLIDDRMAEHEILLNRHANGRDWWLVSPLRNSNEYAVYLVDSSGVMMTSIQAIGIADDRWSRGGGQSVFGPQGQKLVRWNTVSGLQLFDFDRETGVLSNFAFYPSPLQGGRDFLAGGVGLSPSGQYAYVSTVLDVYQYDLWAEDIDASRLRIAEIGNPDSLWIGVAPSAFNFQLGPDCKLYSYTVTGHEHHVIHQPDERGAACQWEQGGLDLLGVTIFRDEPYFPNYRLGKLGEESSQCVGPIVSTHDAPKGRPNYLSVYPNPVDRFTPLSLSLSGVFPGFSGEWELYDNLGRRVASKQIIAGGTEDVSLNGLPKGMYFWQLSDQGRLMNQGKLVVR